MLSMSSMIDTPSISCRSSFSYIFTSLDLHVIFDQISADQLDPSLRASHVDERTLQNQIRVRNI